MARTKKIKADNENLELENSGKVSPMKSTQNKKTKAKSSIAVDNNAELSANQTIATKSNRGRKPKSLLNQTDQTKDIIELDSKKSSSKKSSGKITADVKSKSSIDTLQAEQNKSKRGRKPKVETQAIAEDLLPKSKLQESETESNQIDFQPKRGRKPKTNINNIKAEADPEVKTKSDSQDIAIDSTVKSSKRGRKPKAKSIVLESAPQTQEILIMDSPESAQDQIISNTKSKRGRKPKAELQAIETEPTPQITEPEANTFSVDVEDIKVIRKSKRGRKPKADSTINVAETVAPIAEPEANTFSVDIEDVKVIRKSKRGRKPNVESQVIDSEVSNNDSNSDKNTFSVGIRDVRVVKRANEQEDRVEKEETKQDKQQDSNTFSVGIRDVRVIKRASEQNEPEEVQENIKEEAPDDKTFSVDLRNVKIIQNAESDFEIETIDQEEEAPKVEEKQQFFVNAADIRVVSRARWGHPVYIEIPDKQKKDKKNEFLVDIKDVKVISSGNNPDVIISPYNEIEESTIEPEQIIDTEKAIESTPIEQVMEPIVEDKPKLSRWQKFKEKQLKKKLERQAKRLAEKEATGQDTAPEEPVAVEEKVEAKEIKTKKTDHKKTEQKKTKAVEKDFEVEDDEPIDFSKIEIKYSPKSEFFDQPDTKIVTKDKHKGQNLALLNPEKLLRKSDRNDKLIQSIIEKVEEFLVKEMYIDHTSRVLLAVSGGVDSIVLLDCMAVLSDKYKFGLFVAHYNHKLRGEASDRDEQFVKSVCQSYNIPFYSANGKVKQFAEKNSMSIETAARFLRYSYFERTVRTISGDFLATAHTADDSAETFLMNLIRGAGLTGLSGIPSRRQFIKDVLLIRPIISFKKKQIIEYAKRRRLDWVEDETNMLQQYTRNKIRHDLIPKLASDFTPSIVDIINRAANLIHGADNLVHTYVKAQLPNVISEVQPDRFSIKLSIFNTLDDFLQGEIIQTALGKYFRLQAQSLNIIDRIIELQNSEIGAICEINKKIFAIRERNQITVARKKDTFKVNMLIDPVGKYKIGNYSLILRKVERAELEFSKNPNVEYIDANSLPPVLYLRNWEPGDSFAPLGMQGSMKVSDYLTEKISSIDKQGVLVLSTKTEIIWLIGMRLSDKYKVKKNTKNIIKLEFRTNEK